MSGTASSASGPGRVVAVNVVHAMVPDRWGDQLFTGIDKRPVPGRVPVGRLGLAGDQVGDLEHHGGTDQAVYAYACEDAAWWQAELAREVLPGWFGENLSTEGLDLTAAVVGERWAVGSAVLEVSCPRIPCRVFQGFRDVPRLVRRFTDHGAVGAYLRVVADGDIGAGDPVEIMSRPAHGVTVGETFRALTGHRDLLPRLLDVPELAGAHADRARKLLRV